MNRRRSRRHPRMPWFEMTDHDEMTGCGDWTPPPSRAVIVNVVGSVLGGLGLDGWPPGLGGPPPREAMAMQISRADQDHIAMLRQRSLLLAEQRGHIRVYRA